jgi:hypothetical protein
LLPDNALRKGLPMAKSFPSQDFRGDLGREPSEKNKLAIHCHAHLVFAISLGRFADRVARFPDLDHHHTARGVPRRLRAFS